MSYIYRVYVSVCHVYGVLVYFKFTGYLCASYLQGISVLDTFRVSEWIKLFTGHPVCVLYLQGIRVGYAIYRVLVLIIFTGYQCV